MSTTSRTSPRYGPSRSRLRGLMTALVVAPLLAAGLGTAPVASAQDVTDGGRLGGGSSQLLPDGVAVGSLGGPELTQVDSVDLERYQGEWFQVAAIPQPYTLQCTNDTRAEYAVTAPGTVSVRNSCGSAISSDSVIEGEAKVRWRSSKSCTSSSSVNPGETPASTGRSRSSRAQNEWIVPAKKRSSLDSALSTRAMAALQSVAWSG